ncbi:MAG: 3-hydroxybutyryl-CoA dehydrogenase [Syntrophomonadaceae bacterium]|nr:3-hydroxybutyryl-CoA dehydrogenase [Syntrophomonadaceae bacterium]
MEIKKIMVVGAGQMGGGIAQLTAQYGFETMLNDLNLDLVQKAFNFTNKLLSRSVEKGKMTIEAKEAVMARLIPSTNLEDAKDCDFVIEAVVENWAVKEKVFRKLDEVCPPHTILATNTSTMPITKLGGVTRRPDKVLGMHFMNPAPVMKLVEVIQGLATSPEVTKTIVDLSLFMDKVPVEAKDFPGFISTRLSHILINEAAFCVYEGIATIEGIDNSMTHGMNHRMGPLAQADLIGLDTVLAILNAIYEGFGDPKFRPCPLIRQYVQAGWLGRKSGRGFYQYE